jgi:hypothetical protein
VPSVTRIEQKVEIKKAGRSVTEDSIDSGKLQATDYRASGTGLDVQKRSRLRFPTNNICGKIGTQDG